MHFIFISFDTLPYFLAWYVIIMDKIYMDIFFFI